MLEFGLLNYAGSDGTAQPGLCVGDRVADLSYGSTLDVLNDWDASLPTLEALADDVAAGTADTKALADVTLLAPLLYPNTIFNAASNYYAHKKEMGDTDTEIDKSQVSPYFFLKSPRHCVIGPSDSIRIPHITQKLDWEIELGVVIGRPGRNLTMENARSVVAGYTIVNDLSARDNGRREDWPRFVTDWFSHKNFDGAAPLGPWIVPAGAIPDPYALQLELWVNDDKMQDSEAGALIFNIEEQIVALSERLTLQPGDVIATGTPSGVGAGRGIFLKSGDTVRMRIEGVGEMALPVVEGE